jgi:DNA-binding LytR/AlgR family response regulator
VGEYQIKTFEKRFEKTDFTLEYPQLICDVLKHETVSIKTIWGGFQQFSLGEVMYIYGSDYYSKVYTVSNKVYRVRLSPKKLVSILSNGTSNRVIHIHKSYHVNVKHVLSIYAGRVRLKNGFILPINPFSQSAKILKEVTQPWH